MQISNRHKIRQHFPRTLVFTEFQIGTKSGNTFRKPLYLLGLHRILKKISENFGTKSGNTFAKSAQNLATLLETAQNLATLCQNRHKIRQHFCKIGTKFGNTFQKLRKKFFEKISALRKSAQNPATLCQNRHKIWQHFWNRHRIWQHFAKFGTKSGNTFAKSAQKTATLLYIHHGTTDFVHHIRFNGNKKASLWYHSTYWL